HLMSSGGPADANSVFQTFRGGIPCHRRADPKRPTNPRGTHLRRSAIAFAGSSPSRRRARWRSPGRQSSIVCRMPRRGRARPIERLLTNSNLFGSGASRTIKVSNIKFYSRLPASDASPMSAGTLATSPGNARFVLVTVRPVTLPTILPAAFVGGANTVTSAASAVAGFDQVVCGVTPIYVCNPYETAGMTYDQATEVLQDAAANPADQGRLLILRQYDANAPYAAANYGFLDSPTLGHDELSLIESLAVVRPAACFMQRGVNFRPGFVRSVREAF